MIGALMTALLVVAFAFIGTQLLVLLGNLWFFPVLTRPSYRALMATPAHKISILIPARNEAANLPQTLPRVLAQRGVHEVVVLDDASTDATADLLQSFAAEYPALRVLSGHPLPPGWGGKNWACHQLAKAATGDIFIFTDADVRWTEGTLTALCAFQAAEGADFVSVWPRQLTLTLPERLTVPVIDLVLLGGLPYLGVKFSSSGAFSAGNGQLMLWTRSAYEKVGGHLAFRDEVLEDVRMGQHAKRVGLKVALAVGGNLISTRMYRSLPDLVEGFSKNILSAANNSKSVLVVLSLLNALVYTFPWLLGFVNPWWFLVGVLGLVQRALTCLKTQRNPLEAFLQPFLFVPLWLIAYRALRRGGRYTWKGREYV